VLERRWATPSEEIRLWTRPYQNGVIERSFRRAGVKIEPLVLFSEMIYRFRDAQGRVDESRGVIPMRVYYPDEFVSLIEEAGFQVVDRWGGYAGGAYGEGPELILEFEPARA